MREIKKKNERETAIRLSKQVVINKMKERKK
jgi:hypothetical protein